MVVHGHLGGMRHGSKESRPPVICAVYTKLIDAKALLIATGTITVGEIGRLPGLPGCEIGYEGRPGYTEEGKPQRP